MSSSERLLLILHIGFAIFTLGPLTAATMATPRYIRRREVTVVRYLNRATRIYGIATLGIFLFGLFLAKGAFDRAWLSASMTLFIVALVLLFIVERDQRGAVRALEAAGQAPAVPEPTAESAEEPAEGADEQEAKAAEPAPSDVAQVERGRIAAFSGVIALLWLVILFLMVWYGG
jgi:Ca2+/Na+ antiporter